MRDALITLVILVLIAMAMRTPRIGTYLWAWMSLMNPHRLTYGFARTFPFAYIVALVTLVGLLRPGHRRPFPANAITLTMLGMLFWMTVTSFFAIAPSEIVMDRWIFVMKIQVMMFATLLLIRGHAETDRLIWVVVMSVGFYGIKGGIWTILTGGAGRVWGPTGTMMEGNNELAVALVMLVPLMFYLYQQLKRRLWKYLMIACAGAIGFAILGSQSRGALVALLAMALFLGLKSRHPVRASILVLAFTTSAIAFMPESWTARMDTLQSYEADSSAMSRIYTWKTLWNCALDRPLIGAGFGADNSIVFSRYAPTGQEFASFNEAGSTYVAHSIYFQMLGEHGFPGLLLYLALGVATWRMSSRLARQTVGDEQFGTWVPSLMPMVQVSLIGFAVGGAFLSMAYFDVPYYLAVFVVLVDASFRERNAAVKLARPRPQATTRSVDTGSTVLKE